MRNQTMQLKIKRVRPSDLPLPSYQSPLSSGLDLLADVSEERVLQKGERALIPTGIAIELPPDHEAQIRPRSGLAIKKGVSLVNTPGTIDEDYRGEISVIVINHGEENFVIRRGDRIAQMVITPVVRPDIIEIHELSETQRGAGGFGSTGQSFRRSP